MTQIRHAAVALAALALSLSAVPARAGVFVGVGFGGPYYYGRPYCYGRPYYYGRPYWGGYGYYRPYGVGVVVAPPPVVVAPPPPVLYAQPTVVQPAPVAVQSAPVTTVPVTTSSAPPTVPVTTAAPPAGETVAAPRPAPESPPAINQQLQILSSADERARAEAAMELGRMRAGAAVDRLNALLANDPSAQVREATARALGLIGSPRSLNALRYAGQADNDRDVRRSAQFAVDIITTNMRR